MKISGNIGKTLRAYCDKHADQLLDVTADGGYSDGFAYDILLARGWCTDEMGLHTIIEYTVKDTLAKLREIRPCECSDCLTGNNWN